MSTHFIPPHRAFSSPRMLKIPFSVCDSLITFRPSDAITGSDKGNSKFPGIFHWIKICAKTGQHFNFFHSHGFGYSLGFVIALDYDLY